MAIKMSFSSLFLRSDVVAALAFLSIPLGTLAAVANPYTLDTSYSGSTFFDGFNFFVDADPTNGFVS